MEGSILSRFLVASSKASGQGRGAVPETLGSMLGPPGKRKPMRLWPVCSSSNPGLGARRFWCKQITAP